MSKMEGMELRQQLQKYVKGAMNCPCSTTARSGISGTLTLHHANCFAIQHNLEHHLSMAAFTQLRNGVFDIMEKIDRKDYKKVPTIRTSLEDLVGELPGEEPEEDKPKLNLV